MGKDLFHALVTDDSTPVFDAINDIAELYAQFKTKFGEFNKLTKEVVSGGRLGLTALSFKLSLPALPSRLTDYVIN